MADRERGRGSVVRPLPRAGAPARAPRRRVRRRLLRPARDGPEGRGRAGRRRPLALAADAAALVADLDAGVEPATVDGRSPPALAAGPGASACTPARGKLAGEPIGYADEVEWLLRRASDLPSTRTTFAAAHRRLDEALPGHGSAPRAGHRLAGGPGRPGRQARARPALAGRRLPGAHRSACSGSPRASTSTGSWPTTSRGRASTTTWATSAAGWPSTPTCRCSSPSLAHLVAHEAYPGHHTEHSRKEAGLVRRRRLAGGDDLPGRHPAVPAGRGPGRPGPRGDRRGATRAGRGRAPPPARHPLRRRGRGGGAARPARRSTRCGPTWPGCCTRRAARSTTCVAYLERWALLPRTRAEKAVEFLTDPTWRAYISCYVEGLPLLPPLRRRRPRPVRHASSPSSSSRPTCAAA